MPGVESLPAWPYAERSGVGVDRDLEVILAEPEIQLGGTDCEVAREFAHDLNNGRPPAVLIGWYAGALEPEEMAVRLQMLQCDRSLSDVQVTSVVGGNRVYYTGYFETPAGMAEAFGGPGVAVDDKTLAKNSLAWYKDELRARVLADPSRDRQWPEAPVIVEHADPAVVLAKYDELQQYRRLYAEVRRAVHAQPDSDLKTVQGVHLDLYQSRVNELTAMLAPTVMDIADWLVWQPDGNQVRALKQRVEQVAPIAGCLLRMEPVEREAFMADYAVRMDRIRNGAARQPDGSFSPISPAAAALADRVEYARAEARPQPQLELDAADIEIMRATKWDAATMARFLETVLADWGQLSQYRAGWDEIVSRSGRAPDGKVQVVVTDDRSALEAVGSKLVVAVPAKFNRSLLQVSPAGALPVAAHELRHIDQMLFEAAIASDLPLLAMGGARYTAMREACGIAEERRIHAAVGQDRPTGITYLRAIQAMVTGGSPAEAARAWADAHTGKTADARALAAGKNVLRIWRRGRRGGYDTADAEYSEQALIMDGVERLPADTAAAIRMLGGKFSLPDMAKLRRAGLLRLDGIASRDVAGDVLRIYLERFHRRPAAESQ